MWVFASNVMNVLRMLHPVSTFRGIRHQGCMRSMRYSLTSTVWMVCKASLHQMEELATSSFSYALIPHHKQLPSS